MRSRLLASAVTLVAVGIATPGSARAQTYNFSLSGAGVSGTFLLTYGATTDAKYPGGFALTGINGSFTDTNNGLNLVNVPVNSLVPINPTAPADTLNTPAPHDFSTFAVATGLPAQAGGVLTYDNLFWPNGSPVTCIGYPFSGGFLDVYGMMFSAGNGQVVDIFSNGDTGHGVDYGLSVARSDSALDYVASGVTTVTTTPEPGTLWLVGSGLFGMIGWRRRRGRNGIKCAVARRQSACRPLLSFQRRCH